MLLHEVGYHTNGDNDIIALGPEISKFFKIEPASVVLQNARIQNEIFKNVEMRFCSNFRNVSYVPGNELFQVTKKQLHAGSYANTDAVQLQEIMPNMISSVDTRLHR